MSPILKTILPSSRIDGSLWLPIASSLGLPREGDVVAVLTGGSVPIVLRPKAESYAVVGDAYIQGVMDCDALKDRSRIEYLTLR